MEKYIKSCKVYNQVKLRSDGCDILEDISTLDGKSSFIWIKAPSVAGLCNFAGISRLTYYNYRKLQGFDEVCEEFELICDEADMDCQYSKEAYQNMEIAMRRYLATKRHRNGVLNVKRLFFHKPCARERISILMISRPPFFVRFSGWCCLSLFTALPASCGTRPRYGFGYTAESPALFPVSCAGSP